MSHDQPPGLPGLPAMQRDGFTPELATPPPSYNEDTRALTRSPYPYHRHQSELLHSASRIVYNRPHPPSPLSPSASESPGHGSSNIITALHPTRRRTAPVRCDPIRPAYSPKNSQEHTSTGSDSGTDADDEHVLKGLPAPHVRLHKGVRGLNEPPSGASTPTLISNPSFEVRDEALAEGGQAQAFETLRKQLIVRRIRVAARRGLEICLLTLLALAVASNPGVKPLLRIWGRDIQYLAAIMVGLVALYPVRLAARAHRNRKLADWTPLDLFRSNFDPAPVLYPPAITLLVSLLIGADNPTLVLPNLILSISSIPPRLISFADTEPSVISPLHWLLSCLPLLWAGKRRAVAEFGIAPSTSLETETNVILYPLLQTVAALLRCITSTSLLPAELQLVTIGLINLLLHSRSPQMLTLAGMLWIGGISTFVLSGAAIRWGIALARVPKWRFRRIPSTQKKHPLAHAVMTAVSLQRAQNELLGRVRREEGGQEHVDADSSEGDGRTTPPMLAKTSDTRSDTNSNKRHSATHTPSGRRKRATPTTMKPFFRLTAGQALRRKWMYAAWVYTAGFGTYLIGRIYLVRYVFQGYDPVCWAAGYLFGNQYWFRMEVVKLNWDRYIPLPPRSTPYAAAIQEGWVERLRHLNFGVANTRLGILAYFVAVMVVGFSLVFRLKNIYEVDTRRKGFHFLMVVWWLPTIFVDPTFVATLYIVNLSLFLAIDLLRASQLPPLSKPIANFIAPYVDGRDLAGPVVVSPIFLAIGCAIPLWLSLGSLPRVPTPPIPDGGGGRVELPGWEVPSREVAMVAGVVCVGLGDAAASLIGRRWGHHKWFWGGSKSLEGSIAFVAAVCAGLIMARAWMIAGEWAVAGEAMGWGKSLLNTGICATVSSATEAVLTGGNDNVIVPVILWTCVKALGV